MLFLVASTAAASGVHDTMDVTTAKGKWQGFEFKKTRESSIATSYYEGARLAERAGRAGQSKDSGKVKGGDLDHLTKGQTAVEFEKAAFALKAKETSDVVEAPFGYHIIKVTERHPAHQQAFDDVKRKVQEYLKQEKTLKMVSSFLSE